MAISLASLQRSGRTKPDRWIIYGPEGVGKTTLAAGAPAPVFMWIEDGAGRLDVPGWPIAGFGQVIEGLGSLYTEEHEFKTLVVDSLDWLERLVWAETCARNGWKSIEDAGYGRGYVAALQVWREYLDGIDALRTERGVTVIQLAHAEIRRFDSPETEPYDRYQVKLHKQAAALVQEHADVIGFLNFRVSIAKAEAGFNKKVNRGAGGTQRVLYLSQRPAFTAKQRLGLPDAIELPTVADAWADPAQVWNVVAGNIPSIDA